MESALLAVGLTHPQFVLLASVGWLTKDKAAITQTELARHCSTDINMTSQVLRSLEKKGYIKRRQKEGDGRSKFPYLTETGAKLIEKALPLVEEIDRRFFIKLKDSSQCVKILKLLAQPTEG